MKKSMLIITAVVALSCNNNQPDQAKQKADTTITAEKKTKPDFSKIKFATNKDSTCGMPLSAGVEDTAIVDGKVYGFCSKECKDEFLKTHLASLDKK